LIAGLPDNAQDKVLQQIDAGELKGSRQIQDAVKVLRDEAGRKGRDLAAAKSAEARKRFTLITDKEHGTVRVVKKKNRELPAKWKVADEPFFVIEGTQADIHVTICESAKGDLTAKWAYKRRDA
jgi:hypothetical protein